MSLIDQRILIVAPVETVWTYVSDPAMMTKWLKNCKQISVLTTRTTGAGTRRRCIDARGRAEVIETTAYFENIGYEYRVVDGPYREFRGRFRLQAIPEGTIVNWTVEYRLRGVLAGLRNLLSFRRHFEDLMADSLRGLRRLVEASGVRLDPESHARYAMQDGPRPEARTARSPETTRPGSGKAAPSAMKPVAVGDDDVPEISGSDIAGPTLVRVPPPPPEAPAEVAPGRSERLSPSEAAETPIASDDAALPDTKPRAPKGLRESLAAQARESAVSKQDDDEEQAEAARAQSAPTVPISLVAPPLEPPQETQTVGITPPPAPPWPGVPDSFPERVPTSLPQEKEPAREPEQPLEQADVPLDKHDTGQMSIWEVFGLERPSERAQAELEGLIASIQPQPDDANTPGTNNRRKRSSRAVREPRAKAHPRVRAVRSKHPPRQKKTIRARPPVRRE